MAGRFKVPISCSIDTAQVADLIERIKFLGKSVGRTAVRKGVNEVTRLVLGTAKALVPKRSGQLRKSLGRKIFVSKDGKKIIGIVKPRLGVWMADAPGLVGRRQVRRGKTRVFVKKFRIEFGGRMISPVKYAHLVEFGRVAVVPKKKKVLADKAGGVIYGTRVRAVPPHPFMRPAWAKYEPQTGAILRRFLMQAFTDYWKKSRGRTPRAKRKAG